MKSVYRYLCIALLVYSAFFIATDDELIQAFPFPGQDLSIRGYFHLKHAGQYSLRIDQVQRHPLVIPKAATVACNVAVSFGEQNIAGPKIVRNFRYAGEIGSVKVDQLLADVTWDLPTGNIDMEIKAVSGCEELTKTGASWSIENVDTLPTERYLLKMFLHWSARAALEIATIGLVIIECIAWVRRRTVNAQAEKNNTDKT